MKTVTAQAEKEIISPECEVKKAEKFSFKKPEVNYLKLRPNNLFSSKYIHLLWLAYWPLYGWLFTYVEKGYAKYVSSFFPMHSILDDYIPFCEWFLIPYTLWFAYIVVTIAYTLFYDVDAYVRGMKYIILTYTVTIIIYFIWPTCQNLRPTSFENDNILIDAVKWYYDYDTNTNVCPSIHVIGSLAIMEMALWSKAIPWKWVKITFVVLAVLISISTVFMKQHSIIDVFAAIPLCAVAHFMFFHKKKPKKEIITE